MSDYFTPTYMLDSNVVISLTKFNSKKPFKLIMQENNLEYNTCKTIFELYNKIESGQIKALISPVVFDEISQGTRKYGNSCINYLVSSKIKITVLSQKQMEVVSALTDHYFKYKSKSREAVFIKNDNKRNWANDAHIMAEASVLGVDILTFDNHFLKKVFIIREANKNFMKNYVAKNNVRRLISKKIENITCIKPTAILESKKYQFVSKNFSSSSKNKRNRSQRRNKDHGKG